MHVRVASSSAGSFAADPAPCVVPGYWCDESNDMLTHLDCDGDGVLDWACVNNATGARMVTLTTRNCSLDWQLTGTPRADASMCPPLFKGTTTERKRVGLCWQGACRQAPVYPRISPCMLL